MLAVLDPNVLVSAAIATAGRPRQIINAWVDGRFELLASPALIDELADVLARPRFIRWISTPTAAEFIAGVQESAVIIDDPPEPAALTPDPDDDYLIASHKRAAPTTSSPATATSPSCPTPTRQC